MEAIKEDKPQTELNFKKEVAYYHEKEERGEEENQEGGLNEGNITLKELVEETDEINEIILPTEVGQIKLSTALYCSSTFGRKLYHISNSSLIFDNISKEFLPSKLDFIIVFHLADKSTESIYSILLKEFVKTEGSEFTLQSLINKLLKSEIAKYTRQCCLDIEKSSQEILKECNITRKDLMNEVLGGNIKLIIEKEKIQYPLIIPRADYHLISSNSSSSTSSSNNSFSESSASRTTNIELYDDTDYSNLTVAVIYHEDLSDGYVKIKNAFISSVQKFFQSSKVILPNSTSSIHWNESIEKILKADVIFILMDKLLCDAFDESNPCSDDCMKKYRDLGKKLYKCYMDNENKNDKFFTCLLGEKKLFQNRNKKFKFQWLDHQNIDRIYLKKTQSDEILLNRTFRKISLLQL